MSLAAGVKGQRGAETCTAACGDSKVCFIGEKWQISLSGCVLIITLMCLQGQRLLLYTETVSAALKNRDYLNLLLLFIQAFAFSSVVLAVIPM